MKICVEWCPVSISTTSTSITAATTTTTTTTTATTTITTTYHYCRCSTNTTTHHYYHPIPLDGTIVGNDVGAVVDEVAVKREKKIMDKNLGIG